MIYDFDKTHGPADSQRVCTLFSCLEPKHRLCICACHPCKKPCNCCETSHLGLKCSYYILSPCLGGNRFRFTTTLYTLRPLQLVVFSYLWCTTGLISCFVKLLPQTASSTDSGTLLAFNVHPSALDETSATPSLPSPPGRRSLATACSSSTLESSRAHRS